MKFTSLSLLYALTSNYSVNSPPYLFVQVDEMGKNNHMAANFCCSIEMEPKTLNEGQLNQAREVAVDIVQNNKPNEASSIFVEGLKPVIGFEEMAQTIQNGDSVYKIVDQRKDNNTTNINESCCQCSSIIESPDEIKLKEPVSAPF